MCSREPAARKAVTGASKTSLCALCSQTVFFAAPGISKQVCLAFITKGKLTVIRSLNPLPPACPVASCHTKSEEPSTSKAVDKVGDCGKEGVEVLELKGFEGEVCGVYEFGSL